MGNYAFVDGQNLHMGTAKKAAGPWRVDLARFRVYLKEKYGVSRAFYFLGCFHDPYGWLYKSIRDAGFILSFREHAPLMLSGKKGNVDADIIFAVMEKLYRREPFGKAVLVSGDGDYIKLVRFLIAEGRLERILFPDRRRASSLYSKIDFRFTAALDQEGVKRKIQMKRTP